MLVLGLCLIAGCAHAISPDERAEGRSAEDQEKILKLIREVLKVE